MDTAKHLHIKVALVHYWLINMRGGEKVIELLCDIFPDADIFTLVCDPSSISDKINSRNITTSFIQKLPFGVTHYDRYLPLHPIAIEQFDLSAYDLVISSESGIAKGVILPPNVCHICYCHSPMRYLWNMYHEYRTGLGIVAKALWTVISNYMRIWDFANSQRVDRFIANSRNVQARIKRYYGRDSEVIYPPVDVSRFRNKPPEGFHLYVGQLTPYKRVDLAVQAFNRMGRELVIIGDGPQRRELEKSALSNIKFLGKQSDRVLIDYYSRCRGFVFPGEEDFGITPLEAMASGKPVIAYAKGGALETVLEGRTGVFFHDKTAEALQDAVHRSEIIEWDSDLIRGRAEEFDVDISREKLRKCISEKYMEFKRGSTLSSSSQSCYGERV